LRRSLGDIGKLECRAFTEGMLRCGFWHEDCSFAKNSTLPTMLRRALTGTRKRSLSFDLKRIADCSDPASRQE